MVDRQSRSNDIQAAFSFISTMAGIPWAGSEELWQRAARCLLDQGHSVAVNVSHWESTPMPIAALQQLGARVTRRRRGGWVDRQYRRLMGEPARRWLAGQRGRLVVISQSCQDGTHWALECKRLGVEYALVVQVVAEFFWPTDDFSEAALEAFSGARRCYFVSSANRALTCRQLGVARLPNAEVIWNPFNVDYQSDVLWPEDETLSLACVGRLDARHKGQDLLLELLARPKWRQRPVNVTFYGTGDNRRTLERLAVAYRLRSVEFAGFRDDVAELWANHHALVLPSRVEGLPLAVIEAMLCGRSCIVTDVGGNSELVEDGVTGFVAKFPTVEALDAALERAWTQRARLAELGETAARSIRSRMPRDPARDFARRLIKLHVRCASRS